MRLPSARSCPLTTRHWARSLDCALCPRGGVCRYIIFGVAGALFICIVVACCVSCRRRHGSSKSPYRAPELDKETVGGLYLIDMPSAAKGMTSTDTAANAKSASQMGNDSALQRRNSFTTWDNTPASVAWADNGAAPSANISLARRTGGQTFFATHACRSPFQQRRHPMSSPGPCGAVPLSAGLCCVSHPLCCSCHADAAQDTDELSFGADERLWVTQQDDDGWWTATRESDGATGYVPAPYLKPAGMQLGGLEDSNT